jgi:hypothetical protein
MSVFRFILRFVALTSVVAAVLSGLVLVGIVNAWNVDYLRESAHGSHGTLSQIALWIVAGGLAVALLFELLDLLLGIWSAAGRRSALGMNVIIQVALAIALVGGINAWSFRHYKRYDLTRDRVFTIDPNVASELKKLSGETTIVVYQQQKSSSRPSDKPDDYDLAAEAKISEKVQDLVEQLREFGPQFRVVVLDARDREFRHKRSAETQRFPELDAAIKSAPDSSIFFCDRTHVQRMSFNEFYLLDKTASLQTDGGRGNLVLLNQGIQPFARHVLAIEEKKPKIGIAVIHELLSTRSTAGGLSLIGMGKGLEANGFEVRNIILKRWGEDEPQPAAYTFEESRLDQLEAELADLNDAIPGERQDRDKYQSVLKLLKESSLEEANQQLRAELRGRSMTEEDRTANVNRIETIVTALNSDLTQMEEDRRKDEDELSKLLQKETVVEGRRMTDVAAKSRRLFDECDLLIIPRMTLIDLMNNWRITPRLYRLSDPQVASIRSYLRSGKPILVMAGPTNEPGGASPLDSAPDNLESLLSELGIVFGDQTILFNAEARAFADRRVNPLGGGRAVEIPSLDFETSAGQDFGEAGKASNPLRTSLRLIARSAGGKLDLVIRYPRPVYYSSFHDQPQYNPDYLLTDPACWNEKKPFPERNYTPRFEPDKPTDPTKGTLNEERRGPFPIGVAAKTDIPAEWISDKYQAFKIASLVMQAAQPGCTPAELGWDTLRSTAPFTSSEHSFHPIAVRVAAIGHGGVFVSADASQPELPAAKEQLLLQTVNWLLGRDDRLPRSDRVWQFPRVEMSSEERIWWRGGAVLGIPMLFAYLGCLVVMVRRMR